MTGPYATVCLRNLTLAPHAERTLTTEMVSAEVRRAVLQELEASLDRIVEKS